VTTQSAEQALFASDRYARLILAQMNKMRLRTDFCDVRLRLGGRVFSVHKLVLAASSPYFSALFSGGMSEADKEEVQILGVEAPVFEVLLEFIYTGSPCQEMYHLLSVFIQRTVIHDTDFFVFL
jgi:actin-binding protein IPP